MIRDLLSLRAPFRQQRSANSIEVPVRLETPHAPCCRLQTTNSANTCQLKGRPMPAALSAHARELAQTFGPHLAGLTQRSAAALAHSGFSGLLVHSGALLDVFQDDRTYPFQAHAPFKVWAPLEDAPDSFVWFAPGARPRLILNQPRDYWYKSAQTPTRLLGGALRHPHRRRPRRRPRRAAQGSLRRRLHRRVLRRARRLGREGAEPARRSCGDWIMSVR